ncbi:MAG: hypothetical protein RLZZ282_1030, partial [Verrucomicrobiota bacterium]
MGGSMRNNFGKRPTLQFREWTGFDDADAVADFRLAGFVMNVVFFGTFDDFIEAWVRDASDVLDDEGLIHFIGDDHANA